MNQTNNQNQHGGTPPATGNVQAKLTDQQNRWLTIAMFVTGGLWFVLIYSILQSWMKNYSSIFLSLLSAFLIALLILHGKHVWNLSFPKAPFQLWRAIYTHFLLGLGTFNLEAQSTRFSQASPWLIGAVPLVLIVSCFAGGS
jgi:hypothetical protein